MKTTSPLSLLLALMSAWIVAGWTTATAQRGGGGTAAKAREFGWFSNLEKARAEALRLDRPLMVVLRCGP